jgi:hypothetical protein
MRVNLERRKLLLKNKNKNTNKQPISSNNGWGKGDDAYRMELAHGGAKKGLRRVDLSLKT